MDLEFTDLLRQHGLKATKQRISVLAVLRKQNLPLSAEAIHDKLRNKGINLVTVYRILHLLEKAHILNRVDLHTESILYELSEEHHHHMVCTSCGRIEDFEDCSVEELCRVVLNSSKVFSNIQDHSLELFGTCRNCTQHLAQT